MAVRRVSVPYRNASRAHPRPPVSHRGARRAGDVAAVQAVDGALQQALQ